MSISKATDYACYLCKKVKFFKTFDNLLKHNCRFHNCEKEDIKEKKEDKIIRLFPNVKQMYFYCVNALEKINKQIIEKNYVLKTYIKIEVKKPIFIHLDEPIVIQQVVTETFEEFEEEFLLIEEEFLLIENITNEMIEEEFLNEYETIVSDDDVVFINGVCYKVFEGSQDYDKLKKKAYFKLSLKYHPDKNSQKNSLYYTEYFKKIKNYYEEPQVNQIFTEDKNYIPSWIENLDFDEYMGFPEDSHNFFNIEKVKYYEDEDYFRKYVKGDDYLINLLKFHITDKNIEEELNKELNEDGGDKKKILKKIKDGRTISLMYCYYIKYGYRAFLYKFFRKNFFIKKVHERMNKHLHIDADCYFRQQPRFRKTKDKYIEKLYDDEYERLLKIIEDENEFFYIPDEDFNFDLNFYSSCKYDVKYINNARKLSFELHRIKTMTTDAYDFSCNIEKYK